jgi:hypothetical protein
LVAAVLIAAYTGMVAGVPRASAVESIVFQGGPKFNVAQRVNVPPAADTAESSIATDECKQFDFEPLGTLTVDVTPIERPGQVTLSGDRPADCFSYAFGEPPSVFLGGEPSGPPCDFLQICCGWQFCHRPLYFEERCLERYGVRTCFCQPGASALHFYCTALLLPVKMIQQPCCRANVLTPCY